MTDIFEGQYPLEQVSHLIRTCRTSSGGGFLVADVDHRIPGYADRARRIAACLNAFEGYPIEELEAALAGGFTVMGLSAYAKGLEAQKKELTKAMEAGGVGCVTISKADK